ncbi:SH3 domain-containing protein [Streptomyces sp. NPDC056255]|uniref:SH3 domain-containing protein n=1 Tax=Streptomyces sp. NPDC056255 TaxID=3345764 RepID=UPI0035D53682
MPLTPTDDIIGPAYSQNRGVGVFNVVQLEHAEAIVDGAQLPASEGDTVDVLKDDPESGWSWCRDSSGREGWVPHRVLRAA